MKLKNSYIQHAQQDSHLIRVRHEVIEFSPPPPPVLQAVVVLLHIPADLSHALIGV